jgi:hypothetical protein
VATFGYGVGANGVKRWLTGVPPVAVAAGSQLAGGTRARAAGLVGVAGTRALGAGLGWGA